MDEYIKPMMETAKNLSEIAKVPFHTFELLTNPAAEECGYWFQEIIHSRRKNFAKISTGAITIGKSNGTIDGLSAPTRLVHKIIEEGSLIDDEDVQKMWAGLLASSCTLDGKDESNLIYIDLLSKLTSSEVALVNDLCNYTRKCVEHNGLISAKFLNLGLDILQIISGFKDVHQIDHIINHLESLGLVHFVNNNDSSIYYARLRPTTLCLNMYVKCQGSSDSPVKYWSGCLCDNVRPEDSNKYLKFV